MKEEKDSHELQAMLVVALAKKQRALVVLDDPWTPEQVRCFFRFFDEFCSLVSQFVRARLEPWARSPAARCARA